MDVKPIPLNCGSCRRPAPECRCCYIDGDGKKRSIRTHLLLTDDTSKQVSTESNKLEEAARLLQAIIEAADDMADKFGHYAPLAALIDEAETFLADEINHV